VPERVLDELLGNVACVVGGAVRDRLSGGGRREKGDCTCYGPLIATEVQPAGDAIRAKVGTSMGVVHVVDALDVAGHSGIL
jgi:hypothetical protein